VRKLCWSCLIDVVCEREGEKEGGCVKVCGGEGEREGGGEGARERARKSKSESEKERE